MNSIFRIFVLVFISSISLEHNWTQGPIFAQSSNDPVIPNDSKNIIVKYCKQYADSVSKGIDVIQDLIGAGILPNSYYGKTCPGSN